MWPCIRSSQGIDSRFFSKAERTHTVTQQYATEDAVMASQIEQLPDLTGYLNKLASRPEWRLVPSNTSQSHSLTTSTTAADGLATVREPLA